MGRRRFLQKHGLFFFCPASFLTLEKVNCRSPRGGRREGWCQNQSFSVERWGFESGSVIDTRATTDKNDPFLSVGFTGKSGWTKNGSNCNVGFGRLTENTPEHSKQRNVSCVMVSVSWRLWTIYLPPLSLGLLTSGLFWLLLLCCFLLLFLFQNVKNNFTVDEPLSLEPRKKSTNAGISKKASKTPPKFHEKTPRESKE